MNIQDAIAYINAHLAEIGSAARMHDPLALDIQAAYAQLCQHNHPVTQEELVNAVEVWQEQAEA